MLKKTLIICTLAVSGFISLQATDCPDCPVCPVPKPINNEREVEAQMVVANDQKDHTPEMLADCKACKKKKPQSQKEGSSQVLACKHKHKDKSHKSGKDKIENSSSFSALAAHHKHKDKSHKKGQDKIQKPNDKIENPPSFAALAYGEEETNGSNLFSLFHQDDKQEDSLLACKQCK